MAFNRRPEGERWTTDDWDRLKGLPWDMVPRASSGREAEVFADKDAYTKPRENYDDPVEYYNSNDDDDGYAD